MQDTKPEYSIYVPLTLAGGTAVPDEIPSTIKRIVAQHEIGFSVFSGPEGRYTSEEGDDYNIRFARYEMRGDQSTALSIAGSIIDLYEDHGSILCVILNTEEKTVFLYPGEGEVLLFVNTESKKASVPLSLTEWRPGQQFPYEAVEAAFGKATEVIEDHPVFASGRVWELPLPHGAPTRVEIFPDRRWASVRYVDATMRPKYVELIPTYVAVRLTRSATVFSPVESGPVVTVATSKGPPATDNPSRISLVAMRDGRATGIDVYATGEVDEYFRILSPAQPSLPPETVIYHAEARAPRSSVTARERPPLPVAEAGELLGYHPTHVKKLIRDQRLIGYKLGRNWYVDPRSLDEFLRIHGRHRR